MRNLQYARNEVSRIARFAVVGAAATLIYLATVIVAVEYFNVTPLWAAVLAQVLSTIVSYIGHLSVTFQVEPEHGRYLPRFALSVLVSSILNIAIMQIVTVWVNAPYQVAAALIAIIVPVANYVFGRFWVFQRRKRSSSL